MNQPLVHETDVLVIGGGLAGMQVALHLVDKRVTLVDGGVVGLSGASPQAKGGVAVAVGDDDTPQLHAQDTLVAGAGFCAADIVDLVTEAGPECLAELVAVGVPFDRTASGALSLNHEAAHSRRRVVRAGGDGTGRAICQVLAQRIHDLAHVELREHCSAVELIVQSDRVVGAWLQHADGTLEAVLARATVLATGGLGQLYARTSNPPEALGRGLALAIRAGAQLADLEFVQFHPTVLWAEHHTPGTAMPLMSEALRGEGAWLVDETGDRFMLGVHPQAELAPRDVVARGIWHHQLAGHRVFLDARVIGENFAQRFPQAYAECARAGLDPAKQVLPVTPAAHYHMGGILVDADGRSTLAGLWACGEVSSTGLHGANRLASNSLLEALVFGRRVAESARAWVEQVPGTVFEAPGALGEPPMVDQPTPQAKAAMARVRALLWEQVGVVRDAAGLEFALSELDLLAREFSPGSATHDAIMLASLMAMAALERRESRGAHFRSDFPAPEEGRGGRTTFGPGGIRSAALSPIKEP